MAIIVGTSTVYAYFNGRNHYLSHHFLFQLTTSVGSAQIAKYSLGGGLTEGARSLHDFYLSLAKQATPVIEVGASKKITVIISEGKELEIRELERETI